MPPGFRLLRRPLPLAPRQGHGLRCLLLLVAMACACALAAAGPEDESPRATSSPERAFRLDPGDLVALVGGADVAAAQLSGHLEALLTVRFSHVRFRNFGWEGDTVSVQPRDVGFPPLTDHLRRAGASVILIQYGRLEAMNGLAGLSSFKEHYRALLDRCARQTPRLVLVSPPPFEKGNGLMPDLSTRNADLAAYAKAMGEIAGERGYPFIDLFAELGGASHRAPRLTDHGLQLTPAGQAHVAAAFGRRVGLHRLVERAGEVQPDGAWSNREFEQLRQLIVQKNRLWLNYWRPQNWAFLGGDRTTQPSSHDHRDPKIRWFPAEIEQFVPLIRSREEEIAAQAGRLNR